MEEIYFSLVLTMTRAKGANPRGSIKVREHKTVEMVFGNVD